MPPIGRFGRIEPLLANFEACLQGFETYSAFVEHPAASHHRTLRFVRQAPRPTAVLDVPEWLESLRVTLRDWNMDMRGAQLLEMTAIQESFNALRPELEALETARLETIEPYYAVITERRLWSVIDRLRIGRQGTRLVVNTKALHHLLPDLVPPMDRTYTFWFFHDFPDVINFRAERTVFSEVWPLFVRIARETASIAPRYLGQSMHTSVPKIIDNAIIGYRHLHDREDPVRFP